MLVFFEKFFLFCFCFGVYRRCGGLNFLVFCVLSSVFLCVGGEIFLKCLWLKHNKTPFVCAWGWWFLLSLTLFFWVACLWWLGFWCAWALARLGFGWWLSIIGGLARVSVGVGFKLSGGLGWLFAFRLSVALKMRLRGVGLGCLWWLLLARWGWWFCCCWLVVSFGCLWVGGFVTTRHGLIFCFFVCLFICFFEGYIRYPRGYYFEILSQLLLIVN